MQNVRDKASALKKFQKLVLSGIFEDAAPMIERAKQKLDKEFAAELVVLKEKVVKAAQVSHENYSFENAVLDYAWTRKARFDAQGSYIALPQWMGDYVAGIIEGNGRNRALSSSGIEEFKGYLESGFFFRITGENYTDSTIRETIAGLVKE